MDDAEVVARGEGIGYFRAISTTRVPGNGPCAASKSCSEPPHVLHDQVMLPFFFDGGHHAHDVGVVSGWRRAWPSRTKRSRMSGRGHHARVEGFDSDGFPRSSIGGHGNTSPHAAAAQQVLLKVADFEAARQYLACVHTIPRSCLIPWMPTLSYRSRVARLCREVKNRVRSHV